jgi:ribonuclease PH
VIVRSARAGAATASVSAAAVALAIAIDRAHFIPVISSVAP